MCAAFLSRLTTESTAVTISTASEVAIVIALGLGSTRNDSLLFAWRFRWLEGAVEQLWRRHGGRGGAGAWQPSLGRSAGGCGRWKQVAEGFFAPECCFFAIVAYVCLSRKVCMFRCHCTRVQSVHVVFRARLGRPKRSSARW